MQRRYLEGRDGSEGANIGPDRLRKELELIKLCISRSNSENVGDSDSHGPVVF